MKDEQRCPLCHVALHSPTHIIAHLDVYHRLISHDFYDSYFDHLTEIREWIEAGTLAENIKRLYIVQQLESGA